ncbi:MAG: hypothetical protein HC836_20255 [Richelia sp. RM2_1_2]|nr:hypothetical protein [Richelia sp. SM2_1_7]NJM20178.1 hypothetical protein [Richelia sp. SM1_7_0]NJN09263.1 hypothetical protein [Richelia sp. RM1_1_1]NJO28332.1 hypothetical protein [Richelia sp. SL_2_1]NJO60508.1 hypothetical protein [Richelia sp. RM2_1_2]NJS16243.1 hypothetical protein [Nostocaceae cyanobacterium CSU_2_110]
MSLNLKALSGLIVLTATIGLPAIAIAETETSSYQTPNEVFEKGFYENYPDFYNNQGLFREIDWIFGSGSLFKNSFPEHQIERDAKLVNILYQDLLKQQTTNDPYLRSPDLPNPYNTSLLGSPSLRATQLQVGTEFRFDSLPHR